MITFFKYTTKFIMPKIYYGKDTRVNSHASGVIYRLSIIRIGRFQLVRFRSISTAEGTFQHVF